MSNSIDIKIDGPKLTPDKFITATAKFFDLLKEVSKNIASEAKPAEWSVQVQQGSAVIQTQPDVATAADLQVIGTVVRGLASLASGSRTPPPGFTAHEIRLARDLAAVVDDDGSGVRSIQIRNGSAPLEITRIVLRTADEILDGEKHEAFGSIEGWIETLNGREGYPLAVWVNDVIHKRLVVCHFSEREHEQQAVNAFLKRRVLINGLIHYSKEGYPTSVDAQAIRTFPPESELPTLEQVQAIYR